MALEGKIRYLRGVTKPRQIERPEDVKGGTAGGLVKSVVGRLIGCR